ncbi:hypothetical protein WDU94_015492 [Cyamophila willieti]
MLKNDIFVDELSKKRIVIDVKYCSQHAGCNASCNLEPSDATRISRCPSQGSSNSSKYGAGSSSSNVESDCGIESNSRDYCSPTEQPQASCTCTSDTESDENHSCDHESLRVICSCCLSSNNAGLTCDCECCNCSQQDMPVSSSILIKTTEPIQDEIARKQNKCQTSKQFDSNLKLRGTSDNRDKKTERNTLKLTEEDMKMILKLTALQKRRSASCECEELENQCIKQKSPPCECEEQEKQFTCKTERDTIDTKSKSGKTEELKYRDTKREIKPNTKPSRDDKKTRKVAPFNSKKRSTAYEEDIHNECDCKNTKQINTNMTKSKLKDELGNENIATKQRDSARDRQCEALIDDSPRRKAEVQTDNEKETLTKAEKLCQNRVDTLTQTSDSKCGRVEGLKDIFETSPKTCTRKSKIPISTQEHKDKNTVDKFKEKQIRDKKEEQSCPKAEDKKCVEKSKEVASQKDDKETRTCKKADVDKQKDTQTETSCEQSKQFGSQKKDKDTDDTFKVCKKTSVEKATQTKCSQICKKEKGINTPVGLIETSDGSTQTSFQIDKETDAKEPKHKASDKPAVKKDDAKKPAEDLRKKQEEKQKEDLRKKQEEKQKEDLRKKQEEKQKEDLRKKQEEKQKEDLRKKQEEKQKEDLRKKQEEKQKEDLRKQQEEKQKEDLRKKQEEKQKEDLRKKQEEKQKEDLRKQQEEDLRKKQEEDLQKKQEEKQKEDLRKKQEEDLQKKREEDLQKKQEEDLRKKQEENLRKKQEEADLRKKAKKDLEDFWNTPAKDSRKKQDAKKPDDDIKEDLTKTPEEDKESDTDETPEEPEKPFEIPKDRECKPTDDSEKNFCKIYNTNFSEEVDVKLTKSEIIQFNKDVEHMTEKIEENEMEKTGTKENKKPPRPTSTQSQANKSKYIREDGVRVISRADKGRQVFQDSPRLA